MVASSRQTLASAGVCFCMFVRMNKIFELKPVFVEYMPKEKEHGILYISDRFGIAIHKCACGCGVESVCDLKPHWKDGWTLTNDRGLITLSPSIGNFNGERPYHAHYYIRGNKIKWL